MQIINTETKAKPFLKWAGGKTQMLSDIERFVPVDFGKYIEPFIGAGALFFHLESNDSVIADANGELIHTYEVIRDTPEQLIEELSKFKNNEKHFYETRSKNPNRLGKIKRAARLIYLNKTCFNGLYRVNRKGQFNTPFGHRKNPLICDVDTIMKASSVLCNTTILNLDFEEVLNKYAKQGDFIFLDPPYEPVSEYADFKRYTKDFFSRDDQVRLKNQFDRLVEIGAHPILTNSDAPFILDLYKDYRIEIIETRRSISSNARTRKGKDIIVIGD